MNGLQVYMLFEIYYFANLVISISSILSAAAETDVSEGGKLLTEIFPNNLLEQQRHYL